MNFRIWSYSVLVFTLPVMGWSQTAPGAGALLRETAPRPELPVAPTAPAVAVQPPTPTTPAPATVPIPVKTIVITGAHALPAAQLRALVAATEGQTVTLAQLQALADQITAAYQAKGFLLAQAYLPAQEIVDGRVEIAVQEGLLGAVKVNNTSLANDPTVHRFVAPLTPGQPITSDALESVLLRLRDVPGVKASSTLLPGATPGAADLVVNATPEKRIDGRATLDNYGGNSTGAIRGGVVADIASPLDRGDRLSLQAMSSLASGEYVRQGRIGYDYALDGQGLRVGGAYSRLDYALGQNFAALDAHGTADNASVWLTRPVLRGRTVALDTRLGFEERMLKDRIDVSSTQNDRNVHAWTAELSSTLRDQLLGGGYTAAKVTAGYSQVDITNAVQRAQDAVTAKTQDGAGRLELSVERWQVLPAEFSLYVHASGQAATGNLDTSDQFGLAGPFSVRAYPQGELYGDEAVLLSTELRHVLPVPEALGRWQGVVFYDIGTLWQSKTPWTTGDNERTLAGVGVGLRWAWLDHWSSQVDAAWRTSGGTALAGGATTPQIWVNLVYGF